MANARLGAALRALREKKRMSLRDLEKPVGLSFTTIGDRERGLGRELDDTEIDAYLKAIGATRKDLEKSLAEVKLSPRTSPTIPLLANLASAGRYWIDRGDNHEFPDGTRHIPRGVRVTHPQAFAVPVEGDSMEPFFRAGDVIMCEPIEDEEDRGRLRQGAVVVAWTSPSVAQSAKGKKPPKDTILIPPGGVVGKWEWQPDQSAILRKDNSHHQAVWIPAEHDGRVLLAVVVEFNRAV